MPIQFVKVILFIIHIIFLKISSEIFVFFTKRSFRIAMLDEMHFMKRGRYNALAADKLNKVQEDVIVL